MLFNTPTYITLFRLILTPLLLIFFYIPIFSSYWNNLFNATIFIIAAFTDWIDGFIARKIQKITIFGAFLDPVADKIIIVVSLIIIIENFHIWWITLPCLFMIIREIVISALREWMAQISCSKITKVSLKGKFKTTTQMLSVFFLLWKPNCVTENIGILMLYISSILALWSMLSYLYASIYFIIKKNNTNIY